MLLTNYICFRIRNQQKLFMKKIFFSGAVLSLILMSCSSTKVATKADAGTYINTITAPELSKHLYIVAGDEMQGRNTGEEGQKKAGRYLIEEYKKMGISYPEAASDWYQKVPSEFMKRGFAPKLNDSENIWAFIKGSEKPDEVLVISAHYDHVGMKNGEIYNGADDDGSGTVALLEIAQAFKSKITVVQVLTLDPYIAAEYISASQTNELIERARVSIQATLNEALAKFEGTGLNVESKLLEGQVVHSEIAKAADEIQADLIIIGSHGRTGLKKFFLGSVAQSVLGSAQAPVLIVRK